MRTLTCLLLILFPATLLAQQFGGNPPSMKWNQINTDTVRIIFPRGLESQGQRVANLVHYINRYTRPSIGGLQRKVNIVLQNQTLESNGYVQLGPFRSEFYLTPPPSSTDLGSLNWEEQLSVHEYRHVLQNSNFRQGVSKVASYVLGEMGQAAVTNIAVPNWFWEGDAVTMETALSPQGRGRLPSFFDGFRAFSLEKKNYNYMKIRNGSFVDYMPNHYNLGYLMSVYGREHYGRTFWKDVTIDAVRYRGLFYPFSQSLKRRTGKNVIEFYHAMLQEYQPIWNNYAAENSTPGKPVLETPKTVTNYKYIYTVKPGQWIVYKAAYNHVPGFFLIDSTGKQQLITRPGINFDDYFSYRNGRIIWTEARFHPRWAWKDYSVIRLYDRATGRTSTLTHGTRYFSPDITADGKRIVAVVTLPSQQFGLQLLDGETGKVLSSLPNPENWYYTFPKFSADEQFIISNVRNQQGQMAMIRQSVTTGTTEQLTPFKYTVLGIPEVQHDTIYYTASYKDVDNVYAITPSDKKVCQVTKHPNGVLHATIDPVSQQIVYSGFTTKGYALYETPLTPTTWQSIDTGQNYHSAWLRPDFKEGGSILDKAPHDLFPVKKYPQAFQFFKFHSWLPTFNDPVYTLSLYGNNILNTTSTSIGYAYNRNEGSSQLSANLIYGGWFAYLQGGTSYTFNRSDLFRNRGRLYWDETDVHAGITIPLNISSGLYSRYLSLTSTYHYLDRYPRGNFKFSTPELQYLGNTLLFSNFRIKGQQNIFSHFGQYFLAQYSHSLTSVFAEQFYTRLDLYLPGFSPNHSIVLNAAYQQRDTARRYSFSDNFVYARGYNTPFYSHVYKLGANYHFPIAYPDWGFAQLMYIMRIRGNVFYDYSRAYDYINKVNNRYSSVGGEVFFDTKLGNVLPFSFGVRFSHLLDQDPADNAKQRIDFIIPIQQLFSY
ncbi:component of the Tol biopolymer transport system [Chitinophaga sp. CF118]|uniref:hypothetical protein n=1 Tax=Chitinophaga sp. CF118 TaxID=1884367 RepID=UPI0008E69BF0|nr:hypothetical protein [Chitinophaga sp. CF118]SFE86859.1 component of the Tol biopolymer transport system [Chitinophaga sp. CF118]